MANQKINNLLKDPRTNWRYILILVVLATIIGGGYWGYWNWWMAKQEIKLTEFPEIKIPKKVEDETANSSSKALATEDWKTYRNEGYGFEVKYPSDFKVDESEDGKTVTFESKVWEGYRASHPFISITVYETSLSALEWLDQNKIFGPLFRDQEGKIYIYSGAADKRWKEPVEYTTIDGVEALKFSWWGVSAGDDNILVKNKNKPNLLYHISRHLAGALENPEETVPKELFNQMLSTFKFIEATEEFCGSSTYGNCSSNSDCMAGGCSSQVCQSKNEEPVITTCEYRDCYDKTKYELDCKCLDNKCQWIK